VLPALLREKGKRSLLEVQVAHEVGLEVIVNIDGLDLREFTKLVGQLDDEPPGVSPGLIALDVLLMKLLAIEVDMPLVILSAEAIGLSGGGIPQGLSR
jgi:hypothetical protein